MPPGQWQTVFEAAAPLMVELGAGRCDFALGYAALFPNRNIIAVDVKPERLWAGGKRALARGLRNVVFFQHNIQQLEAAFAPQEIDYLWITFPDPYPKLRHARRRLTGPQFLEMYRRLMKPQAPIQLKTDDPDLFQFTLDALAETPGATIVAQTPRLHDSPLADAETSIRTYYEDKWIAERNANIHYLKFLLDPNTPGTARPFPAIPAKETVAESDTRA